MTQNIESALAGITQDDLSLLAKVFTRKAKTCNSLLLPGKLRLNDAILQTCAEQSQVARNTAALFQSAALVLGAQ